MARRFVRIANRGTPEAPQYTSLKKAKQYIERRMAEAIQYGPDGEVVEMRMTAAAEVAMLQSAASKVGPLKPNVLHPVKASPAQRSGRQVGSSGRTAHGIKDLPLKSGATPEYLHWRESVFVRDGHRCVWCGSKDNLEADHIKPQFLFPELKHDIDNGRTLCHRCHCQTATYGSKVKRLTDVSAG